jgi:hypothetical protein
MIKTKKPKDLKIGDKILAGEIVDIKKTFFYDTFKYSYTVYFKDKLLANSYLEDVNIII